MVCVDGLTEKTGEQRHEGDTDEGDTAASHKLLHTLRLCTGVVITVTFKQVNHAPNAETGTKSNNESLEDTYSRVKKFHRLKQPNAKSEVRIPHRPQVLTFSTPFKNLVFIDF